jgi:transcriptional regulator with XRE-family HTH domain
MAGGDTLGIRIKRTREGRGITRSEFARRVDVSTTAVWNWENGTRPRSEMLATIAKELGVTEEFLLTGKEIAAEPANKNAAEIVEEARRRIASATGFPLERIKLTLQIQTE